MFTPISLEITVLILGLFLLMFEAFANEADKTFVAWLALIGLAFVFVLTFFVGAPTAGPQSDAPLWQFYKADFTALFFKRFALLTTMVVLIMSIEYKAIIEKFVFGATPEAGLGEFYCLPVFT